MIVLIWAAKVVILALAAVGALVIYVVFDEWRNGGFNP